MKRRARILEWDTEQLSWPNSQYSSFVNVPPYQWHIQRRGEGPKVLLVHGTASSVHSYVGLIEHLYKDFDLLTIDLPGHAFTKSAKYHQPSLPRVAQGISRLLEKLVFSPDIIVGHSAGAAIAVELVGRQGLQPQFIVSLNGAFCPFGGFASVMFPAMAKLMYLNPLTAPVIAMSAQRKDRIRRLIEQTGSRLEAEQIDLYARLLTTPGHISGVLAMMANWDLSKIKNQLADLSCHMLFLAGTEDRAVDPSEAILFADIVPGGESLSLKGSGHLVHEEEPEKVASIIRTYAEKWLTIADERK